MRKTKYKKSFCKDLIEHMSLGHSYGSFPALIYEKYDGLMVHGDSLKNWEKKYPEFAEAKRSGVAAALRFFERFMRYHITGVVPERIKAKQNKKMSSSMVMFALKTRFYRDYGDQLKLQGVENGPPIKTTNDGEPAKINIYIPKNNREKED